MVGRSKKTSDRIAIVTVHGTNEGVANGGRWWEPGSDFGNRLLNRLEGAGLKADIRPHLWTGANKALDRERAGEKLVGVIKHLRRSYKAIHIVAFSHGGTVANFAADDLRWGRKWFGKDELTSITTVGTPYFRVAAGWSVLASNIVFLIATAFGVGTIAVLSVANLKSQGLDFIQNPQTHLFLLAPAIFTLLLALQIAERGVRRGLRPRKPGGKRSIFAIWHRNDEVISGLRNLEALPIEPFRRWSLLRGGHNTASLVGLFTMLVPLSFAAVVFSTYERGDVIDFIALSLSLAAIPFCYAVSYLVYRLLVGGALEFVFRQPLNGWVSGTLRGMAFGKDHEQGIGRCQSISHSIQTQSHMLEGAIAERMQTAAAESASRLLAKHRWSFFSAEGDPLSNVLALLNDSMTWDSLIHTTYFDQPEIADVIGDYIADEAKKAAAEE